jgi:two-component system, cell cycle response regulator DivK
MAGQTTSTAGPTPGIPSPPRVLVVEDHRDTSEMYRLALASAGIETLETSDAVQALREARSRLPDVVVTDLRMPGVDGFEFTRLLKADARTADIPVIAVTALTSPECVARAQQAGVSKVLTKPCPPEHLISAVRLVLDRSRRLRRRSAEALRRAAELCARSARLQARSTRTFIHHLRRDSADGLGELELRPRKDGRPELLCRIAAEFVRAPALKLTLRQAARLWGLELSTCELLLDALIRSNVLDRGADERYRLREGGAAHVRLLVAEVLREQRARRAS